MYRIDQQQRIHYINPGNKDTSFERPLYDNRTAVFFDFFLSAFTEGDSVFYHRTFPALSGSAKGPGIADRPR